jgi:sugar (pentulose or hexulose) kinase
MADVFNTPVVTLQVAEGAAYGAALQALWCWRLSKGEKLDMADLTDAFVKTNPKEASDPDPKAAAAYAELQSLQDELARSLRPAFSAHRRFLNRAVS